MKNKMKYMKRIVWIIVCCFITQWVSAQTPKWAEKAKKAVFSVVTYDKENKIKGTEMDFILMGKVRLYRTIPCLKMRNVL